MVIDKPERHLDVAIPDHVRYAQRDDAQPRLAHLDRCVELGNVGIDLIAQELDSKESHVGSGGKFGIRAEERRRRKLGGRLQLGDGRHEHLPCLASFCVRIIHDAAAVPAQGSHGFPDPALDVMAWGKFLRPLHLGQELLRQSRWFLGECSPSAKAKNSD
jgi:hypothetical protein